MEQIVYRWYDVARALLDELNLNGLLTNEAKLALIAKAMDQAYEVGYCNSIEATERLRTQSVTQGIGTMTPLQIQMMLHYYAICEPYALRDQAHANSVAVRQQRSQLIQRGYLRPVSASDSGFRPTDMGIEYINRLVAVV